MFLEKWEHVLLLIAPILLALIASGVGKYPFGGRFLLVFSPVMLLFVGEGVNQVIKATKPHSLNIGLILVGLLYFHPLVSAGQHLVIPRTHVGGYEIVEDVKPAIAHVKKHWQEGDVIYLAGSRFPFIYYQNRYGFKDDDYITSHHSNCAWEECIVDMYRLKGKPRVWILFSHFQGQEDRARKDFRLYYLDTIGSNKDIFKSNGAAAYLYDLSK